jgi:hypothetical protein
MPMTKRGGPRRKPSSSSKSGNEASGRALAVSADLVLDFLYYDAARVGSFLAQVDGGGHLKQVTQGESVTKTGKRGYGIKASIALPAVPGLTTEGAEGSIGFDRNPSEAGSETGERTYDPFWTNARSFLDFLRDGNLINPNVSSAAMGQFVSHSGNLWLLDMKTVQAIVANPVMQAVISALPEVSGNPVEAQMLFAILPMLELGVQVTLIGSGETVWATLRPEALSVPTGDIMLMHGTQVAGTWHLVGVFDARPDARASVAPSPFEGLAQMVVGLAGMRPHIGRPAHAYGITPLLIYREVSGV